MTVTGKDQKPQLRLKGDWGAFNLTRICGWLAWEFGRRTDSVDHVIHTGRGMADNLFAVAEGQVDISISTPSGFARMAMAGRGPFEGQALPQLRAIGSLPHEDGLFVALRSRVGVSSMAELRDAKPALRVVLAPDDGGSFMGFGATAVLGSSGIDRREIIEWGGELIHGEDPRECLQLFKDLDADAVIQEAIMTRWWQETAEEHELRFLSLEPDAVERLERDFMISTVEVPSGYVKGIDTPLTLADFTGWMVVARDDLPDEIAETLAAILVETSDFFEGMYAHIPRRFSPLAYPITAVGLAATPIPLHEGAARYYRSLGIDA